MRQLIFPLVLGLGGVAVLVALGLWQLDRLDQKETHIAAIEARIGGAPGPLPDRPDRARDRYLPVAVGGRFLEGDLLVLSGVKGIGAGYRIIAPFQTDTGARILVDRGFVSEARRADSRPVGPATLTGNLDWPEESDSYTPPPDTGQRLWFARDIASMAAFLETDPVLLVVRKTSETGLPMTPQPVDTAAIRNDHREYALTWFGLALVWAAMTLYLIRRTLRRPT